MAPGEPGSDSIGTVDALEPAYRYIPCYTYLGFIIMSVCQACNLYQNHIRHASVYDCLRQFGYIGNVRNIRRRRHIIMGLRLYTNGKLIQFMRVCADDGVRERRLMDWADRDLSIIAHTRHTHTHPQTRQHIHYIFVCMRIGVNERGGGGANGITRGRNNIIRNCIVRGHNK